MKGIPPAGGAVPKLLAGYEAGMPKKDPATIPLDSRVKKIRDAVASAFVDFAAEESNREKRKRVRPTLPTLVTLQSLAARNSPATLAAGKTSIGSLGKNAYTAAPWSDEMYASWIGVVLTGPVSILRVTPNPEVYKGVLYSWLCGLGAKPPAGVLTPWRGTPGAPRKRLTDYIVKLWESLDKPYLSKQLLARAVYREVFEKADTKEKNRLVNLCRRAVERTVPLDQIPRPKKAN
jgi:hypothetical protein